MLTQLINRVLFYLSLVKKKYIKQRWFHKHSILNGKKDWCYIFLPADIEDNFLGFYNATHLLYMIHTSNTKNIDKWPKWKICIILQIYKFIILIRYKAERR